MKNKTNEPKPASVQDLAAKKVSELNPTQAVKGHTFEKIYTLSKFISSYENMGFQATNLSKAINEINEMRYQNSKIFFGCTSNQITSGLRDTICYLAKNKYINVFVTTAGGIEEDLIKCMGDTMIGEFGYDGGMLRDNGFNRVGNLLIPYDNYVAFEKWLCKILDDLIAEHNNKNISNENTDTDLKNRKKHNTEDNAQRPLILTPSKFIKILGSKIKNESSILHWCAVNNIPVYCPALTDGSIGDILTFYRKRNNFVLDIVEDIHNMNYETIHEEKTGVIILGSGVTKHHILNANLFKNGAEHCVLLNTANEYDGSDAGASVDEAVSGGKVKKNGGIKVVGDATILSPLIVAATFALENKSTSK